MKKICLISCVLLSLSLLSCNRASETVEQFMYPSMTAVPYPAHVEFSWDSAQGLEWDFYVQRGRKLVFAGTASQSPYFDWTPTPSDRPSFYTYYILPKGMKPSKLSKEQLSKMCIKVEVPAKSDELLLDMVERYTVRYFSDFAEPFTGMARERSNSTLGDIVTTGGTGFGIMALVAGIERGYITEERGMEIFDRIVSFLESAERFHGAWAHWYNADTRAVRPFSKYDDGGDLVETAFLVEGLIALKQYLKFKRPDLFVRIDRLVNAVEWDWYTKDGSENLYWHWSKNCGWKMNHRIKGFDETFITYVLGAASKNHPIPAGVYGTCYKVSDYYYNGKEYYGIRLPLGMDYGGPLFFTHYSWMGLDPRGLVEGEVNYFDRNRSHALIHYNYAIQNPKGHAGLGSDLWGFTSSDDALVGYTSHQIGSADENGTVSPTASIASIVYTPEESMECLRHLYYDLGDKVFGPMGFFDAYNPSLPEGQQVVRSYLAIDQGPIAVMIENYRSGLLWNLFMSDSSVKEGLGRLGLHYEN